MSKKLLLAFIFVFALLISTASPNGMAMNPQKNTAQNSFSFGKLLTGDVEAQKELAKMYYANQDYQEALKWFRKVAEQGDAEAQTYLAEMYAYGKGVKKDYQEALKLYRKAAEQGDATVQNKLAAMYYNGEVVKQDYQEALKWFRKAAEQGHATAQNNLAAMYYNGEGVKQDYQEALKWFRKAAKQGHATAQNDLASMYYNGEGVKQDYQEALKWFRKAAEQGHVNSQFMLGIILINGGNGVWPNKTEGARLLTIAAEHGHVRAQYNLGRIYENGIGVRQDNTEALKWYQKALEQGFQEQDAKEGIYRVQCQSVKYRDVMRNPEQYEDKQISFSGTVIQVLEDGSEITLRISQGNQGDFSSDTWLAKYFRKQGESRILEDDYIEVYGKCLGLTTYESVSHTEITVPTIRIRHYKLLN